jgi:hypothetical protein
LFVLDRSFGACCPIITKKRDLHNLRMQFAYKVFFSTKKNFTNLKINILLSQEKSEGYFSYNFLRIVLVDTMAGG